MTEHEIQTYIWEQRGNWKNLIEPFTFPEKYRFDEDQESIHGLSPETVIFNLLIERLSDLNRHALELDLFGCEVPLKKDKDSTIRADLLGLIPGVSGIVIVEIKKSSQTERQAYTELFAYASHLHSLFPAMSKDDIKYILISPMSERIVREATVMSFLFDEKPVLAFKPIYDENDVTTLKLRPWIPNIEDINNVTASIFSESNIDIFKIAWDFIEDWSAEKGESPTDDMIRRMNRISSYAAQLMEAKGIHGFAFTSQYYPELPFLPNCIIVAGINPFKVARDNHLIVKHKISPYHVDKLSGHEVTLIDIIPELAFKAKEVNEEAGHLQGLIISYNDTITRIASDVVNLMTYNTSNKVFEHGWNSFTWKDYQTIMLEDGTVFNYNIKPTGLLRTLFAMYSIEDFKYIRKYGYENHPSLNHGDVPEYLADYLNDQTYFRDFLLRLYDPWHDIRDDIEEYE